MRWCGRKISTDWCETNSVHHRNIRYQLKRYVEELMKKLWPIALLFLFALPLSAKTIDKNIKKSFKINEGASLYLKHGDGDVNISSWNKDVIDVVIVYRANFSGLHRLQPDDFEVEFEQRGDKVSIIGREPNVMGIGNQRVTEYTYTIMAPSYVEIESEGVDGNVVIKEWNNNIKTSVIDGDITINDVAADFVELGSIDGDIEAKSIAADLECRTVDGKIELEDLIDVNCRAKTVDGDITIKNSSGEFSARSVDGDIAILRTSAVKLEAHTTDGKIALDLFDVQNMESRIKTSDGNVRIHLENGTSASLKITTGDGRIRTNLSPVSNLQTDDNYFSGEINGGRGMIEIRTGDGNVDISEQ